MRHCASCKVQVDPSCRFCPRCGQAIQSSVAPSGVGYELGKLLSTIGDLLTSLLRLVNRRAQGYRQNLDTAASKPAAAPIARVRSTGDDATNMTVGLSVIGFVVGGILFLWAGPKVDMLRSGWGTLAEALGNENDRLMFTGYKVAYYGGIVLMIASGISFLGRSLGRG